MLIYKVLRADEWRELDSQSESAGAPVDRADGFIHFSTAGQLAETLARHFAGEEGLVLLALDAEALAPALKWEHSPSRGEDFPHLYGPLRRADVLWHAPIERGAAGHVLPPDLA